MSAASASFVLFVFSQVVQQRLWSIQFQFQSCRYFSVILRLTLIAGAYFLAYSALRFCCLISLGLTTWSRRSHFRRNRRKRSRSIRRRCSSLFFSLFGCLKVDFCLSWSDLGYFLYHQRIATVAPPAERQSQGRVCSDFPPSAQRSHLPCPESGRWFQLVTADSDFR